MTTWGIAEVKVNLSNLEFGVLIATLLFGVSMVQTYNVLLSKSNGQKWLKPLVAAVFAIETVHTATMWIYLRTLTVTDFGSLFSVLLDHWSIDVGIAMFDLAGEPVRAYFTYRTFVLSNRRWSLCGPLWFLELVNGGLTFACAYTSYQSKTVMVFQARWGPLVFASLILAAIIDIANAGCLCWYLRKYNNGLEGMRTVSKTIIIYTLETGAITSVAALVTLILYIVQPHTGIWVTTLMIYSKLYSNALLACLGSRERLRQRLSNNVLTMASSRHSTLRPAVDVPQSWSLAAKDRHAFSRDNVEIVIDICERQDVDSYPPKGQHESCRIDTLTVVTDPTHTH